MKTTLRFIKLSNKWFVDIPWDGDISDLQMVDGADLMLDALSYGNFYVNVEISTNSDDLPQNCIKIAKIKEDGYDTGCYYSINTFEFKGEIWLCNVTKYVLGEFPNMIYLNVL